MTRNILPKDTKKFEKNSPVTLIKDNKSKNEPNNSNIFLINFSFDRPFATYRVQHWHTNEEIFNILSKCSYLFSNEEFKNRAQLTSWFTEEIVQRPRNGSVFLFDRRKVKNFKKDGFNWKRRKTGGANSVREDRMYLKINGVDCIYGCYSHSSIISTFHRRCYWLLDKPDFVLVHYLQTPNTDTAECYININLSNLTNSDTEANTNTEELKSEIKSMLWPYYFNQNFLNENLKIFTQNYENFKFNNWYEKPEFFLDDLLSKLFDNESVKLASIRVNLMDQNLNEILSQLNENQVNNEDTKKNDLNHKNQIKTKQFIPKNSEDSNKKNVQLSINSCLSNSEEKIFLISDWSNFSNSNFKIVLCGKELITVRLNQNVLECKLPNLNFIFENSNRNDVSIESPMIKTFIYIYKNDSLYCDPLSFIIKQYESSETNKGYSNVEAMHKNQFLILEKLMLISKIYQFNITDYYFSCETPSDNSQQSHKIFEQKISYVLESTLKTQPKSSSLFSDQLNELTSRHDGKTLLHLFAECNFYSICENLKTSENLDFLSQEINLEKKDSLGNTPCLLALKYKNEDLCLFLTKWHFENCLKSQKNKDITSWSWYSDYQNLIKEAESGNNTKLKDRLDRFLIECRQLIDSDKHNLVKRENMNKKLTPFSEQSIITNYDLNSLPSPNQNVIMDENFNLIENLCDLSCFLSEDTNFNDFSEKNLETFEENKINVDLNKLIDFDSSLIETYSQKFSSSSSPPSSCRDEQDEKIKALADNIIAAMPNKIKSHRFSTSSNLLQQKGNYFDFDVSNQQNFTMHRNSTSFDESIDCNYQDPRISLSSCYSSSTRSSLSPTTSISYQYDVNLRKTNESLDDSPGDDSVCSSSFHIDSPPSTAEFCQYFHASSSSIYYKNAIEKGFSQLTLTDDEQRELYEAALIIQNAYRRYILRKKKKIKVENTINSSQINSDINNQNNIGKEFDSEVSHIYPSSSSASSFTSDSILNKSSSLTTNLPNHDDDDENNSSSGEDHKQYEAACVIQKYYRRYKQYENLHKYTEAAVKIQTRYRAYKSTSLASSKFRANPSLASNFKSQYNHSSIDEATISDFSIKNCINDDNQQSYSSDYNFSQQLQNQKQVARKLINIRQSSRFSPAASTSIIQPNKSTSNLNRKLSSSSLNNFSQFNITGQNEQNFPFYENDGCDAGLDESNTVKPYVIEPLSIDQHIFQSNLLQEFNPPQYSYAFTPNEPKEIDIDQNYSFSERTT
ncbi:unnamed protein product [Brachionus calyciflorus]|uniref:CG-1 domain-containing protein n=1 Tax=Brachionus calyciflorus TaxID=104777 RepID=A0A813LXX1_9BILA|nr:unnamed protein product [Brachionus calyciflorus]